MFTVVNAYVTFLSHMATVIVDPPKDFKMSNYMPSPRLLEAFARGEATVGGMAEAGWLPVGRIAPGESIVFVRKADDDE